MVACACSYSTQEVNAGCLKTPRRAGGMAQWSRVLPVIAMPSCPRASDTFFWFLGAPVYVWHILFRYMYTVNKNKFFKNVLQSSMGCIARSYLKEKQNTCLDSGYQWESLPSMAKPGVQPTIPQQILKWPVNVYGPIHCSAFILDIVADLKQDSRANNFVPLQSSLISTPLLSVPCSQFLQQNLHYFGCLLFYHLLVRGPRQSQDEGTRSGFVFVCLFLFNAIVLPSATSNAQSILPR